MTPPTAHTPPPGGAAVLPADRLAERLAEARERTLALVAGVSEEDLDRQFTPLLSPLAWDLGHIAAFEDLWICHRVGGLPLLREDLAEVYDAAETPRARRSEIPFLRAREVRGYMDAVRERALGVLEWTDPADPDPLLRGGFVFEMLVQHEHQHNETMLQALNLAGPGVFAPERRPLPRAAPDARPGETVSVPGGPFPLGAAAEGFAYDNERPLHEVDVPAFEIDRLPVTNGQYLEFVEDGGYRRRELWSRAGWAWREEEGAEGPLFWTGDGRVRDFGELRPLDPALPVAHVSWWEADAFARWRGMRLPTEAEWEKAATWDPVAGRKRPQPWGSEPATPERANVDQLAFGPAPAGALPAGAAPCGALGLVGDLWEWTASELRGYPGFRAFPYPEYSEIFLGGGYRVLRGGSWATRPSVARPTFRNWDHPERRQIFTGFRCAGDA